MTDNLGQLAGEQRTKLMKTQAEVEEALRGWVAQRKTPFVMRDVAAQVFGSTKVDRALATQIGIGLIALGCTKLEDRLAKPRFFYRTPGTTHDLRPNVRVQGPP